MGEEVLSSDAGTIFGAALIPIAWHMGCDRRLEQTPLGCGLTPQWLCPITFTSGTGHRLLSSSLDAFYFFYFSNCQSYVEHTLPSGQPWLVPALGGESIPSSSVEYDIDCDLSD